LPRPHIDDSDLVRIIRRNAVQAFDSSLNNLGQETQQILLDSFRLIKTEFKAGTTAEGLVY